MVFEYIQIGNMTGVESGSAYWSLLQLIAFIILQMLIIHVPLLVALVTGDLVSGEAAMGTLRMMGTKPISRNSFLLSKFLAGAIYTFFLTVWLAFLSLIVGQFMFGTGDLIVLNSDGLVIIPEYDIMWRYCLAFCLAVGLTNISGGGWRF